MYTPKSRRIGDRVLKDGTQMQGHEYTLMAVPTTKLLELLNYQKDQSKVAELCKEISNFVMVDGKPLSATYEIHFAGRLKDLLELVTFFQEIHFEDFTNT